MHVFKVCIIKVIFIYVYGSNILITPKLKSQYNTKIDWKKYKYIVIGNKGTKDYGREWAYAISKKANINLKNICIIASVSKWSTLSPGSKYVIRNSIIISENTIPVYIDWNEEFSKSNKIFHYPTILVVTHEKDSVIELKRVDGKYSDEKMKILYQVT